MGSLSEEAIETYSFYDAWPIRLPEACNWAPLVVW